MEENQNDMNNSSEDEENTGIQEVQSKTNWKDEIKKEWGEMNEEMKSMRDEWNNDPDMPKSKSGKIVYGVIGFAIIIGIIAVVGYCGKQAFHTIASEFFFLKPSAEDFLQDANGCIHRNYSYDIDFTLDQVNISSVKKYEGVCPEYPEEKSVHYGCLVEITDESILDKIRQIKDDPDIEGVTIDIAVGKGHVYANPITLPLDSDYLSKEEVNNALDEFEDEWNELFDMDDSTYSSTDEPSSTYQDNSSDNTYVLSEEEERQALEYAEKFNNYYMDYELIEWAEEFIKESAEQEGSVVEFHEDASGAIYMGTDCFYFDDCVNENHEIYLIYNVYTLNDTTPMYQFTIAAFCDECSRVTETWVEYNLTDAESTWKDFYNTYQEIEEERQRTFQELGF